MLDNDNAWILLMHEKKHLATVTEQASTKSEEI